MIGKNFLPKTFFSNLAIALSLGSVPVQAMLIDSFSDEALASIFRPLPRKDLGNCAQVCIKWNNISSDDVVWKEQARHYKASGGTFSLKYASLSSNIPSWKEIVKTSYLERKAEETEKKQANMARNSEDALYRKLVRPSFERIENQKKLANEGLELGLELTKILESFKALKPEQITPQLIFESINLQPITHHPLNPDLLTVALLTEPLNLPLLTLQPCPPTDDEEEKKTPVENKENKS